MSEKRRDNKGRLLRSGERQRSDGMYEYRYIDARGKKHSVYSWRLVQTDRTPPGKRSNDPLRELERQIERDVEDGIEAWRAHNLILNTLFDDYIESKYELKQSTRTNYRYMYNKYIRDDFGLRKVADINYSDIRKLYNFLLNEVGFKPNSLDVINTILHPVFAIAVRDGVIRTNPTDGVMAEIRRTHTWEKPKRHALTIEQQEAFINYVASSEVYDKWLPLFTLLLGTGCRIGEALGLRWKDCDFRRGVISINHTLIYRLQDSGAVEFHVTKPKTQSGVRVVPMLREVKSALLHEYERQLVAGFNTSEVDGYSGFIFMNKDGDMLSPHCVNRAIKRIYTSYNQQEKMDARASHREPILIPHFTAHNLRHTFCTRFCENETNLKVIQDIMGHADIRTTMDIYNEATMDKKRESFENLEGKIKIS